MISIDRQPWAHRGGPAFVTSELNPIADPRCSLMNWLCSPSLFNWCRVPFWVDCHYVSHILWSPKNDFQEAFTSTCCRGLNNSYLDWTSTTERQVLAAWNLLPHWGCTQCFIVRVEAFWVYQLKGRMSNGLSAQIPQWRTEESHQSNVKTQRLS